LLQLPSEDDKVTLPKEVLGKTVKIVLTPKADEVLKIDSVEVDFCIGTLVLQAYRIHANPDLG